MSRRIEAQLRGRVSAHSAMSRRIEAQLHGRVAAHSAMSRRIDPSWWVIELYRVLSSWYVLFCSWDGAYKISLAANRKKLPISYR